MSNRIQLEPEAQAFAKAAARAPWLSTLGPHQGRLALDEAQAGPVSKLPVDMEDLTIADSPSAQVSASFEHADLAAEAPLLGRVVPELGQADIRETYLRGYRIVYRTDGQYLWVLTVFEGSRQLRSSDIDDDG